MNAILDFGWVLLIVGVSLLPIWIAAQRRVLPGRRRLIAVLAIACLFARGFGYFGFAWEVLLALGGGWAFLVLWAATAATAADARARDAALESGRRQPGSVVRPRTEPEASTAAAAT